MKFTPMFRQRWKNEMKAGLANVFASEAAKSVSILAGASP